MVVKRRRPCARRQWTCPLLLHLLLPVFFSVFSFLPLICFASFSFCSFFPIFCLLFFSSSLFSHCHFLSLVFLLLILIFLGYHLGDYGRFAAVFEWICYIEFKGELKNTCKRIDNEFEDFKVLTSPQRTKHKQQSWYFSSPFLSMFCSLFFLLCCCSDCSIFVLFDAVTIDFSGSLVLFDFWVLLLMLPPFSLTGLMNENVVTIEFCFHLIWSMMLVAVYRFLFLFD